MKPLKIKKKGIKLIIAGSRSITLFNLVERAFEMADMKGRTIEIVSGGAKGVDRLGELLAKQLHIPIKRFPADWNLHGRSAGYIRNTEMANYADELLAIWDGESKGTKHMINIMKKKQKVVYEFNP